VTTRGFEEKEMRLVADLIAEVLANVQSPEVIASVAKRVHELTERFPLYRWKQATATVA
jgi:glycine hydroxymethyltransferase